MCGCYEGCYFFVVCLDEFDFVVCVVQCVEKVVDVVVWVVVDVVYVLVVQLFDDEICYCCYVVFFWFGMS